MPVKLSIIIPVYRTEATLERCLKSVTGQTFSDFEVILVDDGSPDGSPQQCDRWALRDQRIHVIHKPNGGLSDARNAGLELAQGDYVTFVDSDDYIAPNTYEAVIPIATQCDMVEFPIFQHYDTPRQQLFLPGEHVYDQAADYWLNGYAYKHSYACNKIYRRSLFQGIRFPVGRVFEDMATLPLLVQKAGRIITTDEGCYYYVENPDGITCSAQGKELQMLLDAHLQAMKSWCDDRYYLHVLNIQLDVFRFTGQSPVLPQRKVSPFVHGLNMPLRAKALLLNLLGIKKLCAIQKTIKCH